MLAASWPARAAPLARRALLRALSSGAPRHSQLNSRSPGSTMARVAPTSGAAQGGLSLDPSAYPTTRRDESVVDTLHGVEIRDPYRWLEDPDSPETQAFVAAQNELTSTVLEQCESRAAFKELMTRLYDYPRYGLPHKRGDRYVYSHNTGLQAQSVLFTAAEPDGEPVLLLDPNKLSDDGTVALGGASFSKDGKLWAYTLSSGGSDWVTVHVMSVDQATGEPTKLADELKHVKFSSLSWMHDGADGASAGTPSFFYHRYPAPKAAELGTEVDSNQNKEMWHHVVGRPQSEDTFLWAVPDHPTWHLGAEMTDDGRYLLLTKSSGCEPTNALAIIDLAALPRDATGTLDLAAYDRQLGDKAAPLPLIDLIDNFEASWEYVANDGPVFTFQTNYKAPRNRLLRTDISTVSSPDTWEVIIPEHEKDVLQWTSALKGDALVCCWLRNVCSALELRSLATGNLVRTIPLPGLGSVSSFSGDRHLSEAFFSFTSFTDPGSSFRFDVADPDTDPTLFRKTVLKGGYSPADDFTTDQAWAVSADGTRVPYFLIHRKGAAPTPGHGDAPALLYGYGGFNISLEPGFSLARLCWLLGYGGVAAVANCRGGGEFGVSWRDAGSSANKQNVFDDFIAVAEAMVADGWTRPGRLAIQGGSNGGLLVAACATQRPDLYAAGLAQVGVMDMLRFHRFTIGHAWQTDYGYVDKEADFKTLLAYSPLHNVRAPADGAGQFPAMMLTTGDHDDRVVPLHSHKLTATLQHELVAKDPASTVQRNPLVTRIQVRAGHGAGKPTELVIAEVSDMYAFAATAMGAPWVGGGAAAGKEDGEKATA